MGSDRRVLTRKVGIIGCGTIGRKLAMAIEGQFSKQADLAAVCDVDERRVEGLVGKLRRKPKIASVDQVIQLSDLVVEAASMSVSAEIVSKCLAAGKDVLVMSCGGLLGRPDLLEEARKKNVRVYIPSGAISGLDGVKGAAMGRIEKVTLTTRKPPRSFEGAPYVVKRQIDLDGIKEETVLFEGPAEEAIKEFPKNVNVAASLSLAALGGQKTRVRVVADPKVSRNTHEIELEGEFGRLVCRTENVPSPDNPRTSALAGLSALAVLKGVLDPVRIGT